MQADETVYEFGSSPDEDDENDGKSTTKTSQQLQQQSNLNKQRQQNPNLSQQSSQGPTRIAGTNLRPNKASSTSIDQKLNTSFSSQSDNYNPANASNVSSNSREMNSSLMASQQRPISTSPGDVHEISASEEQLLIKAETSSSGGFGGASGPNSSNNLLGGSVGNTSNTSLSSTTNSSRGNISQTGNQSGVSVTSQKSLAHQQSSVSSQQQNPNFDSNVISERVKNLATQIYQELKRIISRCNYDEDILSGLMPLIVRVLESLDLALIENQQLQVELELCKDDNEQLVVMFEKEKAAKRAIDKKLIESEYAYEEERQQYQQKIESLDNVVKMFELKTKNASDQATRFEEKEAERKREYNKLHDRYTELLKSHCDIVERFRNLAGSGEIANVHVLQQTVSSSSESAVSDSQTQPISRSDTLHDDEFQDKSVASMKREPLRSWNADTELTLEDASLMVIDDMVDSHHKTGDGSSHNESDRLTSEHGEGEHEKEGENDSIAYTSMEKEFRKLIQENKDLLNTKNALNVVKDDLIAEVDRLTNEVSMYEQAVEQLNSTKDQMKHKVSTLDAELRKTKEELEKAKQKIRENNEEGVPYSLRKRFGRAEMAKVLMERNNYKERFLELQDAVRYTELVRANRVETEKRSGLWKFFNNLFGTQSPTTRAILGSPRDSSPVISYNNSTATSVALVDRSANQTVGADALQTTAAGRASRGSIWSTNQRLSSNSDLIVLMDSDLNVDRNRAASRDRGGRLNSDASGYIHAYGWSLRASSIKGLASDQSNAYPAVGKFSPISGNTAFRGAEYLPPNVNESISFNSKLASLQVPIPQYCRPLTGDSLGMKIWCATTIDLSGGDLAKCMIGSNKSQQVSERDMSIEADTSGSVVNISATTTPIKAVPKEQALEELENEVDQALNKSLNESQPRASSDVVLNAIPFADDTEELSTCVWICSTQYSRSKITIIDIKTKPNELLDSFYVPTFLYSIKSIPGCKPTDMMGIASRSSDVASTSADSEPGSSKGAASLTSNMIEELIATQKDDFYKFVHVDPKAEQQLRLARYKLDKMLQEQPENDSVGGKDESTSRTQDGQRLVSGASQNTTTPVKDDDAEISRILDNNVTVGIATLQKLNDFVAHTQPHASIETEPLNDQATLPAGNDANTDVNQVEAGDAYYQPISTHLSTVWMGGNNCILYIHSAIGQWKECIACVQLPDSILKISHFRGRVFVALADGSLCVFFRNNETKQWDFSQYLLINIGLMYDLTSDSLDLHAGESSSKFPADIHSQLTNLTLSDSFSDDQKGQPSTSPDKQIAGSSSTDMNRSTSSTTTSTRRSSKPGKVSGVHCLEISNKNLWLGYRNRIFVFDPINMRLKHTFNVVPQVDNQVRQLVSMKDGVFICLRSDLTLRLYSSLTPYQHIQNIDIEPAVTRMISPKTFVISHITSVCVIEHNLWIGIAHGIILTIPCKLVPQISEAPMRNSKTGEFEESPSHLSIARFVPSCDVNNAQISFHGHRDAVKFFLNAHGLMLSGGQGYLDFRLDMDDQSKAINDKSHLILWQLPS